MRELFPICRSITGDGLRQSLAKVGELLPLTIHEVATGTEAFDWTVPKEWNIRDAYIKDAAGRRVVDFQQCNLHVVNYSAPVNTRMPLKELRPHLHVLEERPEWIPYRTSYYAESWGFCLSQRQLEGLSDGEYEVVIDSSLQDGALSYGECVLPGQIDDEFLISVHICHPSLANDNLSGVAVATAVARVLASTSHRYTYRFLFLPGTIGPITWLSRNQAAVERVKHGLVLACVGDRGGINYKRSRRLSADIDRAVEHVLRSKGAPFEVRDFSPYGYDERQYCSPGFNLPVGSFRRTPHGEYPEYHTSADNLEFVSAAHLVEFADHAARGNRSHRERSPLHQSQSHGGTAAGTQGTDRLGRRQGSKVGSARSALGPQSIRRRYQRSRYRRTLAAVIRSASPGDRGAYRLRLARTDAGVGAVADRLLHTPAPMRIQARQVT